MDQIIQIALFLLLGVLLYALDAAALTRLYRMGYNMTHQHPMDPGIRKGFLLQQKGRVRLSWAWILTAAAALATLLSGRFFSDTTRVVLNLLSLGVGLSLGFVLAPLVLRHLPGQVRRAADLADELEETAAAQSDPVSDLPAEEEKAMPLPQDDPPVQDTSPEGPPDWRKGIDDFLKK